MPVSEHEIWNFELSEKFRAETFRHAGYVCCTPFCIMTLNCLLTGFKCYDHMNLCVTISLVFAYCGYKLITKSYDLVHTVDRSKYYAKYK